MYCQKSKEAFENEAAACILQYHPEAETVSEPGLMGKAVYVHSKALLYHLVAIPFEGICTVSSMYFQRKSFEYANRGIRLVHLWQDCWETRCEVVRSRIAAHAGTGIRIHARKTEIRRVAKNGMQPFFDSNHLQGAVTSRRSYGLYLGDQPVAMASFGAARNFVRDSITVRSYELLRYANLLHHTVVGGLGKLIAHFVSDVHPDDIMTQVDLDWASGKGYGSLNFIRIAVTSPLMFWVHPSVMIRYYPHRLPKHLMDEFQNQNTHQSMDNFLVSKGYIRIYNSGNLKYLLRYGY
jgi:hypothetical protein